MTCTFFLRIDQWTRKLEWLLVQQNREWRKARNWGIGFQEFMVSKNWGARGYQQGKIASTRRTTQFWTRAAGMTTIFPCPYGQGKWLGVNHNRDSLWHGIRLYAWLLNSNYVLRMRALCNAMIDGVPSFAGKNKNIRTQATRCLNHLSVAALAQRTRKVSWRRSMINEGHERWWGALQQNGVGWGIGGEPLCSVPGD